MCQTKHTFYKQTELYKPLCEIKIYNSEYIFWTTVPVKFAVSEGLS